MKILITSGGTREMIDGVRCITNISSGKLAVEILEKLIEQEQRNNIRSDKRLERMEFIFIHTKGSAMPPSTIIEWHKIDSRSYDIDIKYIEVTDTQSVMDVMEELVPTVDVVIHPMAVSDFAFAPIKTKLKSNDPEAFIESMKERIYRTPKILSHIKEWNPNCFLISFKFEDGVDHDELIRIAFDSLLKNKSDIVIANEKQEMNNLGIHRAYFVTQGSVTAPDVLMVDGKPNIANKIVEIILTRLPQF